VESASSTLGEPVLHIFRFAGVSVSLFGVCVLCLWVCACVRLFLSLRVWVCVRSDRIKADGTLAVSEGDFGNSCEFRSSGFVCVGGCVCMCACVCSNLESLGVRVRVCMCTTGLRLSALAVSEGNFGNSGAFSVNLFCVCVCVWLCVWACVHVCVSVLTCKCGCQNVMR